ncbi:MAG TPA: hypothetical protein VK801_05200, partial [Caulobacteraceae bacterium]|nr:hypothetical protein [Caulobacteraceae bacterium]
ARSARCDARAWPAAESMRRTSWSVALIVGFAVLLAVGAALLPDRPFGRWSSLHGTIYAETKWIYERTRFDPTPIDIAIVGTSRSREGVSAPRLDADLAARGLPLHAVNFSLVQAGRGSDLAMLDELLRYKKPKLIIYEIQEYPNRLVHPAYKFIGSPSSVATSLLWRNSEYVDDLVYLPYRQMKSLWEGLLHGADLGDARFVPSAYPGPERETTGFMPLEGEVVENLQTPAAPETLSDQINAYETTNERRVKRMPAAVRRLGAWDDRAFLERVVALAHSHGVPIVFLHVPYFESSTTAEGQEIYGGVAPIWDADFLRDRSDVWNSIVHLTGRGGGILTDWLSVRVADFMRERTA